jgi:hypothetical protein
MSSGKKYLLKTVLKMLVHAGSLFSNGCGRDLSANKLCMYMYVMSSGREAFPMKEP